MPMIINGLYGAVKLHNLTELDAVNMALMNAGESPLSALEGVADINAIPARQALWDSSRDVQLEGWHFNTEHGVKLEPMNPKPNVIPVPENALRVDLSPVTGSVCDYLNTDIVMRGDRLYDLKNHTDKFDHDLTVTVVYLLPFEQLPEAARHYIALKAARRFRQSVTGGDDGMGGIHQNDELRARTTLMREDTTGVDMGFLTPRRNTFLGHDLARVFRRRL